MSRARKSGEGDAGVIDLAGNGASPSPPPVIVDAAPDSPGPDPWAEAGRLQSALNDTQIALRDANRLLAEVKAQRNAHADEIMLLRAQLKVAVEDGNNGWAAASAAGGQTH